MYDNPKTAVTKILKGPYREEHTVFSSLRAHYLFDSEFCNPAKANEKGTVENLVKFVRLNTMVPVPHVSSLEELNEKLINWCERQRRIRIKDWEEEKQALQPLPTVPFKCAKTKIVSSNNLLLIEYDRNHYSIPAEYAMKSLRLEAYVDKIKIYDVAKLVATHGRCYRQREKIMQLEHYLPVLKLKPRASKNALVVRKLPQVYQTLRTLLCNKSPEGYREFANILLLNQEYDYEEVLLAVEESLHLGSPNLGMIKYLLVKSQNIIDTKTNLHICSNINVPVDSPAKYDRLLGGVTA